MRLTKIVPGRLAEVVQALWVPFAILRAASESFIIVRVGDFDGVVRFPPADALCRLGGRFCGFLLG